jgi:O-antigen/teichoic acid export membrane protein
VRAQLLLILASGMPVAVSLVLTPLITSNISTFEYGSYVSYLTLCSIINVVVGLSSAGYVSNAHIHPEDAIQITSSMAWFMLMTIAPAAIFAGLAARLSELPDPTIAAALVLTGVFNYVTTSFQSISILRRQYGNLLVLAVAQVAVQVGVVALLLLAAKLSLWGLILGNLGGGGLAAAYVFLRWRRRGQSFERPKKDTLLRLLVYGTPMVPHMLLSLATGSFDRWYLVGTKRIDDLAVYAVALSVSGAVFIALDVWNKLYSPSVFEQLKMPSGPLKVYVGKIGAFIAIGVLISGMIAVAGYYFIIHAFDPKYRAAARLCVFLCFASGGFALYYSAAPFLYYFNRTGLILFSSSLGAIATAVFSASSFGALELYGLIYGKFIGFVVTGVAALAFALLVLKQNRSATNLAK